MVERVLCKHEVVGSNPSGSTTPQARGGMTEAADTLVIDREQVLGASCVAWVAR